MKAKVLARKARPFELVAGTIALLLIPAAFSGPAWAITGGQPDGNRHPSVGAVILYNPTSETIGFASGTLIHPRVLLTAGHIVGMVRSGQLTLLGVSFDQEVNLEDETTWLPVSAVVGTFTGFNADPRGIDIGTIILRDAVTSIAPATLPPLGLLDDLKTGHQLQVGPQGTRFTVVGYGMLLDWPPPRAYRQDTPTRNTAQSGYHALNGGWLFLNQNLAQEFGGTARGDSGGPTFWTDPDSRQEILVSIASWGDAKFVATGITYRIDTVDSLTFISNVIESLEAE